MLAGVLVGVAMFANAWASTMADSRAKEARVSFRHALQNVTAQDVLSSNIRLPDGLDLRSVGREDDGATLTIEVTALWQVRCVTAHIDRNGVNEIRIRQCRLQ